MNIKSCFSSSEIELYIFQRYKVRPTYIYPWYNQIYLNKSTFVNNVEHLVWDFVSNSFEVKADLLGRSDPLYIGSINISITGWEKTDGFALFFQTTDVTGITGTGYTGIPNNRFVLGSGFGGDQWPSILGQTIFYGYGHKNLPILSPSMAIDYFNDATGTWRFEATFTFVGFQVFIA